MQKGGSNEPPFLFERCLGALSRIRPDLTHPVGSCACRIGGQPKNFRRTFKRLRQKTVGSKNAKIKTRAAPSYPHFSGRIFEPMTRTQTRTYGVAIPSSRQPLLEAMLPAFCWLVSKVASTLGMIFNRTTRDWHTDEAREAQLPTPNDPTQKEARHSQPSFSGKATGRIPGIPVATTQGTTTHSHAPQNQDARDKPRHDSVIVLQTGSGPSAASPAKAGIQSARNARSGNRQTLSPLIPTDVGIQGTTRCLSRLAASIRARSTPVPGFRRFILSQSKDVGVRRSCCARSA
jgi:hypothetical protein